MQTLTCGYRINKEHARCHAAEYTAVIDLETVSPLDGRCHAAQQSAKPDLWLQAQPEPTR